MTGWGSRLLLTLHQVIFCFLHEKRVAASSSMAFRRWSDNAFG
jgi:hypothetical protein